MDETGQELLELLGETNLAGVPLLVYANKQDLLNAHTEAEIVTSLNLQGVKGRQWSVQQCSAKSGEGLQDGMEWLIEQINKGAAEGGAASSASTEKK